MANPTVNIRQLSHVQWLNNNKCGYVLSPSVNDVWRIGISQNIAIIDNLSHLLSADEHERANRYYREKDKHRFMVSRIILRVLLSRYLSADPQQLAFEIGENKKPRVKGNSSLHYNVSHSGNIVLIGIASSAIGVDVEKPDTNIHYTDIMGISCSQNEIDHVNNAQYPLQTFYTLWTRKEALLKATAKGIDDDLKFVPSIDGIHYPSVKTIGSATNWLVNTFKIDHEHLGSIAAVTEDINFWDY